jgi:DNA-binding transcriptional LysR family regulator
MAVRFDLVDLQVFVAVADARSITGGAAAANLALASVSERIRKLEAASGVALLDRGRRGVTLTAAGDTLLDHARLVLHQVATMQGDLAAYARGIKGRIRLLANTAGAAEHLPQALASFLAGHPDLSIDVEEHDSAEIAGALASGAADIGLAIEQALPDTLTRFPFCEDRLVLVVPANDRRASAAAGAAEEFRCDLPDGGGGRRHRRGAESGRAAQRPRPEDQGCQAQRWLGDAPPGDRAARRRKPVTPGARSRRSSESERIGLSSCEQT